MPNDRYNKKSVILCPLIHFTLLKLIQPLKIGFPNIWAKCLVFEDFLCVQFLVFIRVYGE